jgi:branched-chain amino acid transport system substrate-binding protein
MISPANTNPAVTDRGLPNVYRVIGRDDVQGSVAAQFAYNELRARSAYALHDKTSYGQGAAALFRQSAERLGIRVVGFEGTEQTIDFTPIITAIKAGNPDVVYFGGLYGQAAVFFQQARKAGIRSTFLGPDGLDSSELAMLAGQSVLGLYYTTVTRPAATYPQGREFAKEFRSRFNKDPELFAAEAYDATLVGLKAVELAVQQTGGRKPSRKEVSTAVRRLQDVEGLTGSIAFDEMGDRRKARYFVLRVESSSPLSWGQNQLVKTIEAASPSSR